MTNEFMFVLDDDMTAIEPYATIVCKTEEDYNDIQKAIEKQIAIKPIEYQPLNYCCPICNRELFFDKYDENLVNTYWYCNKCGQKIDWGDYDG